MTQTIEQLQEQIDALRAADGLVPINWAEITEEWDYPLAPRQGPEPGEAWLAAQRATFRQNAEDWRTEWVNSGQALKTLRDTFDMYFLTDVPALTPGQRIELLRHMGTLLRPFCPEAADILETTGTP